VATGKKGRAAATAKSAAGPRRYYLPLALVAVAAIAVLGYAVIGRSGEAATRPVERALIPTEPRELMQLASGIRSGPDNAPVKILTFIDFQCPACRAFGVEIEPLLREQYIATGKVQVTYFDWPIVSVHPHAFLAARAARCSNEQGRFWDYHDVLLGRQSVWSPTTSVIGTFADYAAELGMDRGRFDSCLKSDQYAQTVTASMVLGEQLGVSGTPTIFVNGRIVDNWRNWSDFRQLLDAEAGS
jgi:protein-disulfide isomerase